MGSVAVAALIAKLAFVGLLIAGIASGELRMKGAVAFAGLGAMAWLGLPSDFVTSALALIDVALVLIVCKGDVRIT